MSKGRTSTSSLNSSGHKKTKRRTDFSVPTDDDPNATLFDTLMNDPLKRMLVMQLLESEKSKIEAYKREEQRSQSPLIKLQRKHTLESPTALLKRRVLEKQQQRRHEGETSSDASGSSSYATVSTDLLKGISFYVDVKSKNEDRSGGVKALLRSLGAIVRDEFSNDVTHIIFKDGSFNTYQKARLRKAHLISVLWLEAVRTSGKLVNERDYPALGTQSYDQNISMICEKLHADYNEVLNDERSTLNASIPKPNTPSRKTALPRDLYAIKKTVSSSTSFFTVEEEPEPREVLSNTSSTQLKSLRSPDSNQLIESDLDSDCGVIDGVSCRKRDTPDSIILDTSNSTRSNSETSCNLNENEASSSSNIETPVKKNKRRTLYKPDTASDIIQIKPDVRRKSSRTPIKAIKTERSSSVKKNEVGRRSELINEIKVEADNDDTQEANEMTSDVTNETTNELIDMDLTHSETPVKGSRPSTASKVARASAVSKTPKASRTPKDSKTSQRLKTPKVSKRTSKVAQALKSFEQFEDSQLPETSQLPESSQLPETSRLPETAQLTETAQLLETSQRPETSRLQETSQLPELPEASQVLETSQVSEGSQGSKAIEPSQSSEVSQEIDAFVTRRRTRSAKKPKEDFKVPVDLPVRRSTRRSVIDEVPTTAPQRISVESETQKRRSSVSTESGPRESLSLRLSTETKRTSGSTYISDRDNRLSSADVSLRLSDEKLETKQDTVELSLRVSDVSEKKSTDATEEMSKGSNSSAPEFSLRLSSEKAHSFSSISSSSVNSSVMNVINCLDSDSDIDRVEKKSSSKKRQSSEKENSAKKFRESDSSKIEKDTELKKFDETGENEQNKAPGNIEQDKEVKVQPPKKAKRKLYNMYQAIEDMKCVPDEDAAIEKEERDQAPQTSSIFLTDRARKLLDKRMQIENDMKNKKVKNVKPLTTDPDADTQTALLQKATRGGDSTPKRTGTPRKRPELPIKPIVRRSTMEFVTMTPKTTPRTRQKFGKKPSVVCTRFHRKDYAVFRQIVDKLGRFDVEDDVTSRTTHLIAAEPKRTVNILRAITRGLWIVRSDWLYASLEQGKWLPEEEFEMIEFSDAVQVCRKEHEMFGNLYSMDIFLDCGPIYIARSSTPARADLQELISLCKGTLVSTAEDATIVVGEHAPFPNVTCVRETWLLDSITQNSRRDFENYILSVPPRTSDHF